MLLNYFTTAYRSLTKNLVFSLINVAGLSLGIAAFILILQYISFETSINSFHQKLPQLYRVLAETTDGKTQDYTPPLLATRASQQFGEVEDYCRVAEGIGNGIVTWGEAGNLKSFKEEKIVYSDGSFFDLFSFPVREGSGQALKETNTVVISASIAKKYFNSKQAVGQLFTLNNQFGKVIYKVVAVYEDFPANSDLHYDLIFSLQTFTNPANLNDNSWASLEGTSSFLTSYLLLQPGADYKSLEAKVTALRKGFQPDEESIVRLQPMKDMHLPALLSDYYIAYGNLSFIYLLGGIAVLIVVIAWFNYINLSTAGALKRAKEVGVRKVVGASRKQIIFQFLSESFLLNGIALLVAFAFVNLLQPLFNVIIGKSLSISLLGESSFWIAGLLFLIIGSLASGMYAAFALSSFSASQTLKGAFSKSGKGIALRKTLVVFQFSISVLLIASTFILYQQLQFMQNKNTGMNMDHLLVITGPEVGRDSTYRQRTVSFKNELTQTSFVEKLSSTGSVPTQGYNFSTDGITRQNPLPGDEKLNYSISEIDDQFLSTYGIELAAGKNFTAEECGKKWNEIDKLILNERAALQLGFDSPEKAIGEKVKWGKDFEIVGIVKDYHHLSMKESIAPTIYFPRYNSHFFTVKLHTGKMQDQIAYLEKQYKAYFPGNPFEFFFVDENYNRQYQNEQHYGQLFTVASCLAIFIACLGLFGLATFTVEQRTKEIGIRKVLGASVVQISSLLSKDFLALVIVAILIATPLSWWAMDKWLQDFEYKIEITWWFFGVAGLMAITIALLTVSAQAIRAALSNPVKALKNE